LLTVDVRVVAATNRNLKAAVAARQYREDLYFRLSVFPITVPPLRDRPGDIPLLARYFIDRFCRELRKKPLALSPDAADALTAYAWRGNVRELQNCIERAVILTDGDAIYARHLSLTSHLDEADVREAAPADPWEGLDLSGTLADATRRTVAELERRKIGQALKDAAGNVGRVAETLQVSHKVLLQKIREYGLS
jgi:transcriptional regulator with GAF, ATPase, and Fis domain